MTTPSPDSQKEDVIALGAGVFALCLWSCTTTVNKIAVAYLDGLSVGVFRSALAGVLALIVVTAGRIKGPRNRKQFGLLIISGWTSFAIWPTLMSVGLTYTTAGHAGLVMALIPIMTVLFSHLCERRFPGSKWWSGALVALGATVWLMLNQGISLEVKSEGAGLLGDLIVFSGVAFCAMGYVAGGRLSAEIGALPTTLWSLVVASFLTLPVTAWLGADLSWEDVPKEAWGAVLFLTLVSSFLGYGLWFFALGRGGVQRIGSLQLAMPAMTLTVATLLLGESLEAMSVVAAAILIGGTVLAHRHAK